MKNKFILISIFFGLSLNTINVLAQITDAPTEYFRLQNVATGEFLTAVNGNSTDHLETTMFKSQTKESSNFKFVKNSQGKYNIDSEVWGVLRYKTSTYGFIVVVTSKQSQTDDVDKSWNIYYNEDNETYSFEPANAEYSGKYISHNEDDSVTHERIGLENERVQFRLIEAYTLPDPVTATDEDISADLNCSGDYDNNNDKTFNSITDPVNVGSIDDRTCYSDYTEVNAYGQDWGVYNITYNTNHIDSPRLDGTTLQPRIERASSVNSSVDVGSYVNFEGIVRIIEVGDADNDNDDGTYIIQGKGTHADPDGVELDHDPAICLYLAKPVFGLGVDSNKQVAFDIYAERILSRAAKSANTVREKVFLKRVHKNEEVDFKLKMGFRTDPTDSTKKIHYCDATIGGDFFPFNIPDPETALQSKIRYGVYRVKGGRAQIRWANTSLSSREGPITTSANGDWNKTTTWVGGTVPTSEDDVIINHKVVIPTGMGAAAANSIQVKNVTEAKLELRQNNTLTVEGDISLAKNDNQMVLFAQNGNFSTVTIGGTVEPGKNITIIKRLSQDKWTLVSSGLKNSRQFKTFRHSSNNTVETETKIAFGSYDDTAGAGEKYTYVTKSQEEDPKYGYATWGSGIGWATKSDDTTTDTKTKHDVVFTGDLHTDDVPVPVSTGGNGYNLVGNPYPTYLYGNSKADATNNVLTANSSLIDGTIWFWDSDNDAWVTKNLSSNAFHIQPLQGFFVKTTSDGNFSFTEAMQTHESNSNPFYKTTNTRFEIDLSIAIGKLTRKTSIRYIDGKTTSFDNGYDSNIFGGYASELELYTGLVDGNASKKLAIQSLPNENYEDMIIPVGVTADADSEIIFSAEALNVPTGYKVFLEDRLKSTFTRLDEVNSAYTAIVSEKSTEGRFYLHAKSSALSTDTELLNSVSIYKSNTSTLRIVGLSQGKASVKLFNILGKQVMSTNFNTSGVKEITLPNLASGVYIVQLETEAGKLNKKIVLE